MAAVDPVTLEVVGNYLVSAVREMGTTLMRTAYSTLIREEMDCSTALFDPAGQLVAQADHVPSHQGTLSLAAIVAACLDNSERLMREDLRAYPNGRYAAEGFMDGDGISDTPVRIAVTVTLDDGDVTVDFTGSSPQVRGPFNCALSSAYASVYCAVRYMVNPLILQNEGCYRPIRLVLPERSIVKPVPPAPLSGRFHTLERIANTIVLAFNQARGVRAVGSGHAHLTSFSVSGRRPDVDAPYVFFEILGGGWGATPAGDGLDATFGLMANCLDAPIEAVELEYPLRVERYGFLTDSAGAGRHRGGLGLRREVRYLSGDGYFTNRSDAQKVPPAGVLGGADGAPSRHWLVRADGTEVRLPSKATNLTIAAGDLVCLETPGGGGWGPPAEREPDAVLRDALDGKISEAAARGVYRVAVDLDGGRVDAEATAALRAISPPPAAG